MLDFCKDRPTPKDTAAFLYCSFTDSKKQRTFNIICSLLLQIAQQLPRISTSLVKLYNDYTYGEPPIDSLKRTLRSVLEESKETFLFIDALDECLDETGRRNEILNLLTELSEWALPKVHILITSREEPDIKKALTHLKELKSICIQNKQQRDIEKYVKSVLTTDPDFTK